MAPFSRVVIGIGGSERAGDALALARRLVDPRDGELILAWIDGDRSFRLPRGHARSSDGSAGAFAAAREQIGAAVRVTELSRTAASVARGLTETAEETSADLVVVGSGRQGGDGHIAPGQTGMRLLQGAPCAVAIAPQGLRETEPFRHVGVAYDGSPEAAAALAAAYGLAGRERAAVSLYWVTHPPGTLALGSDLERAAKAERLLTQQRLDEAAESAPPGLNPRTVLLDGDPATAISAASAGIIDVLFAGSRGYGPLHRALAGSVAEALLLEATQPVVITPRSGMHAGGEPPSAKAEPASA
jgi:nucleotide-binding universal stress UspA family protein